MKTEITNSSQFELKGDLVDISDTFNMNSKQSPFNNTGLMINGKIISMKTEPDYNGPRTVLGDILEQMKWMMSSILMNKILQWEYLKGSKTLKRVTKDGHSYNYSEGAMIFPDALDNASRTIITGEGGKSPSRFKTCC